MSVEQLACKLDYGCGTHFSNSVKALVQAKDKEEDRNFAEKSRGPEFWQKTQEKHVLVVRRDILNNQLRCLETQQKIEDTKSKNEFEEKKRKLESDLELEKAQAQFKISQKKIEKNIEEETARVLLDMARMRQHEQKRKLECRRAQIRINAQRHYEQQIMQSNLSFKRKREEEVSRLDQEVFDKTSSRMVAEYNLQVAQAAEKLAINQRRLYKDHFPSGGESSHEIQTEDHYTLMYLEKHYDGENLDNQIMNQDLSNDSSSESSSCDSE